MLCATFFVVLFAGCARAPASDAVQARSIEGQVWSPYCPGRLLIDCTTPQARELRDRIRARVDRGETTAGVLRWVSANYGEEALARPNTTGGGLVIWLVPVVLFAVGAVVLAALIRRWTRAKAPAPDL
jgi:cytochrome c-type biogenesis protein CcmH/NrfF